MKCYAFVIPNLPAPTLFNRKKMKWIADLLNSLEGMIAITPSYPQGTILFFETLNQAKIARNKVLATGNAAGRNIMHAEIIDGKDVKIGQPVDGGEVDARD